MGNLDRRVDLGKLGKKAGEKSALEKGDICGICRVTVKIFE